MTGEKIVELASQAADKAVPELVKIMETAIKQHGLDKIRLDQSSVVSIGLAMNDVQGESFNVGVRLGLKLLMDALDEEAKCESAS